MATEATGAGADVSRPPSLSPISLKQRGRSDGELFYFIRNGVRNTGMPGWQLPDQQTCSWCPISAICRPSPPPKWALAMRPAHLRVPPITWLGLMQNPAIRDLRALEKTPMANVVRDPREHPDAIIPDSPKPTTRQIQQKTTSP